MDDDTFPSSIYLYIHKGLRGVNVTSTHHSIEIPMLVDWTAQTLEAAILRGRPKDSLVFGGQGRLFKAANSASCA